MTKMFTYIKKRSLFSHGSRNDGIVGNKVGATEATAKATGRPEAVGNGRELLSPCWSTSFARGSCVLLGRPCFFCCFNGSTSSFVVFLVLGGSKAFASHFCALPWLLRIEFVTLRQTSVFIVRNASERVFQREENMLFIRIINVLFSPQN